ncbi:MAG: VOC family protein [Candidatus Solibacter sp.]|nr:VOC family protein [Candidatus Solibacter sp.]
MVRYVLLWALPSLLCAADSRIDHVTIAGSELKQMQAKLAAVGIASVYGGAHSNQATEMALVSFPDGSYLELMAIPPNAAAAAVARHAWSKFLQENAGPCAWAMREKNLSAEVSRLKAAGIAVSAPVSSGRTRPDGVRLDWETSDVGGETRGTFFPFLIQDRTPRAQRAFPQGKPVTREFRGVTRVVISVRNLDDAIQRYRQAYGVPRPIKQVDQSFQGSGGVGATAERRVVAGETDRAIWGRAVWVRAWRGQSRALPGGFEDTLVWRRNLLVR